MRDQIWTRDFTAWVIANTFIVINFYLLMPTMAGYAMDRFGAPESMAGLAAGLFVIGAVFVRLIAGKYLDLIGRRKMLRLGAALFFLASVAYWQIQSLAILYLIRFLHGVAFGLVSNALMTIAVSALPARRRGEGTGYLTLSTAAASAIGPSLALALISRSYDWLFAACAAVSFLAAVTILPGKVEELKLAEEERQKMKTGWRFSDLVDARSLPLSLVLLAFAVLYTSILAFLNTYAEEKRWLEEAYLFFPVYAVMLFVSRPLAGRLMDRKGENVVLYPAFILYAVCFLMLAWAPSGWVMVAAAAPLAFGFGIFFPAFQSIIARMTPPHRLGLALSTCMVCLDAGTGVGGYVVGFVAERVGFENTYLLMAAMVAALIPVYHFVHGRKAQKPHKTQSSVSQNA